MKKLKREGFTLVELLAVITIIGIVMVFAIPNVSNLINKSKKDSRESNEKTLLMAGKSYMQANNGELPKVIGSQKTIKADDLKKSGYLKEDLTDGNKKICMKNSFVTVIKSDSNKYLYSAKLLCPGDSSEKIIKHEPNIEIHFYHDTEELNVGTTKLANRVKIEYRGETGYELAGYNYSILVSYGSDDYTQITSDFKKVDNKLTEGTLYINLADYIDVTKNYFLKVAAGAYNVQGYHHNEEKTLGSSPDGPKCGNYKVFDYNAKKGKYNNKASYDSTKGTNGPAWIKSGPRKVVIDCVDETGVGCQKEKYTKIFLTNGTGDDEVLVNGTGRIEIKNNRGARTWCNVLVNIDDTAPSIPTVNMYKWIDNDTTPNYSSIPKDNSGKSIVYENAEWSKKNVYTEPKSTDAGVGMGYYQYTTTGVTENDTDKTSSYRNIKKDGKSYIKWRACDKLENCSEYSDTKSVFVAKDYNITYDLDGGVNNPNNPTIYNINSNTITLAKPTKKGYTFVGWSGTGISGTKMDVSIPKGSTGNRSYKAHWSINTMTIYYKASKGEVTDAAKKNGYGLNSDRIVTKNGATYSEIYNYGDNLKSDGLMDYNSSYNFEVKYVEEDISYTTRGGNEWKCISGCDNVGRYYSLSKNAKYKVSDFCNLDDSSCEIVLDVAWVQIIADWRCADDLLDYYIDYCLVDDGENINTKECHFSKKGYFNENGINANGATIDETGGWIIRGDLNNSRTCFIDSSPGNTDEGYRCKSKSTTLYHIVECSAARCYYDNEPSGMTERNNFRGVDIRTGKICVKYNTVTYDTGCIKFSGWSQSGTERWCSYTTSRAQCSAHPGYTPTSGSPQSYTNSYDKRVCNIDMTTIHGLSGFDLRTCTKYTRTCLSRNTTTYTAGCAVWNNTKEYYCESKD